MEQYNYKVRVSCITFNHAPYIIDAMNGFCMQQSTFPFVCTIFDDCSTDGEQEVIRQYLQEHFDLEDNSIVKNEETDDYMLTFARHKTSENCFFAVYYLKYNHYSIGKGYRKNEYSKEFTDQVSYIALCEGDDYWTDPLKLQKQVDYMDTHPECTMVCNRTKRFSERQQVYINDSSCIKKSGILNAKDVIRKGGLYISTCSIVYKKGLLDHYPDYCRKCHVGDYPLQIWAAMNGHIYYFNIPMSVYRIDNPTSWIGRQNMKEISDKRLLGMDSEIKMLKGFSNDYPSFSKYINQRIARFINMEFRRYCTSSYSISRLYSFFADEIKSFSLWGKIDNKMMCQKNAYRYYYEGVMGRTLYKRY